MEPADLNRFLAVVRKTRFIDYLDPIGMTAEEALEQRLKWARRNQDNPERERECEFLLANSDALRELVRSESEAPEEWIEAVEAGMDAPSPVWGGDTRVTQLPDVEYTQDAPTVHVGSKGADMPQYTADDLPTVNVADLDIDLDAEDAPTVVRKLSEITLPEDAEDAPTVVRKLEPILPPDEDADIEDPTVIGSVERVDEAEDEEEEAEDPTVFVGRQQIDQLLGEHTGDEPTVAGTFDELEGDDPDNERTSITRLDDLSASSENPASDLGARLAEVRARRGTSSPDEEHTVYDTSKLRDPGHTIIPMDLDDPSDEYDPSTLVTPPIPGTEDPIDELGDDHTAATVRDTRTPVPPLEDTSDDATAATYQSDGPQDAVLSDLPPPPAAPLLDDSPPTPAPAPSAAPPPAAKPSALSTGAKPAVVDRKPVPPPQSGGGMSPALTAGLALVALVALVICVGFAWQTDLLAPSGTTTAQTEPAPAPAAEPAATPEPAVRPEPVAAPAPVAEPEADTEAVEEPDTDAVAEPVADAEPVEEPAPEPRAIVHTAPVPAPAPAPEPAPAPVVRPAPTPAPVVTRPAPAPAPVVTRPTPAPAPAPVAAAPRLRSGVPAAQSSDPAPAQVVGTWRGNVGANTNMLLRLRTQNGGNVTGKVEIYDGVSWTEATIAGTYDPASGALQASGSGVTLNGTVNGETAVGSVSVSGQRGGWSLNRL